MTWQDYILVFGTVVAFIESIYLVLIYLDDHRMKEIAEESILVSKESLAAQKEYLALRRKWYESRTKKKTDEKVGLPASPDPNNL